MACNQDLRSLREGPLNFKWRGDDRMKNFFLLLVLMFACFLVLVWAVPTVTRLAVKIFIPVWVLIVVLGLKLFRPFKII